MKVAVLYSRLLEDRSKGFARWILTRDETPPPTPEELETEFACVFKDDSKGLEMLKDILQAEHEDVLEYVFRELNVRPERYIPRSKAEEAGHTSMSVGDVVEVDGAFYQVMPVGFRRFGGPDRV